MGLVNNCIIASSMPCFPLLLSFYYDIRNTSLKVIVIHYLAIYLLGNSCHLTSPPLPTNAPSNFLPCQFQDVCMELCVSIKVDRHMQKVMQITFRKTKQKAKYFISRMHNIPFIKPDCIVHKVAQSQQCTKYSTKVRIKTHST